MPCRTFVLGFGIVLLCLAVELRSVLAEDLVVWQGQYYTDDTFHEGTFEINFTVFDERLAGTACFSNVTDITTGAFGEWHAEQWGVSEACDNASKDYWLEISVDGVLQPPRKKIAVGQFIRQDVDASLNNSFTFEKPQTFNSNLSASTQDVNDLIVQNSLSVISNTNSYFSGLVVQNQNDSTNAASTLYVSNDRGVTTTLAVAGSGYTPLERNMGGLLYGGNDSFMFAIRNDSNAWKWRTYFLTAPNGTLNFNIVDIMQLSHSGRLDLYRGNINLNGNALDNASTINATTVNAGTVQASSVNATNINATAILTSILNATTVAATGTICDGSGLCLHNASGANIFDQMLNTTSTVRFSTLNTTILRATGMNATDINSTAILTGTLTAGADVCISGGNCLSTALPSGTFDQALNTTSNVRFASTNTTTFNATTAYADALSANSVLANTLNATAINGTTFRSATINTTTLNATTVSATTVSGATVNGSAYGADGLAGITSSSLMVCGTVTLGVCGSPCTLQIHDGLIVGCT